MGSSQSTTSSQHQFSEKHSSRTTTTSSPNRERTAHALLSSLAQRSTSSGPAPATVTYTSIEAWQTAFEENPKNGLAQTVLHKNDFLAALIKRDAGIRDLQVFNVMIPQEGTPVTNQKSSGRCWLFAACNVIRIAMIKKYNLESFELSQSYLFFYDSLSKANYFLETMLELAEEPIDSRIITFLLEAPENDGGQYSMIQNLIEKFGLVPQSVFPESFNSSNTSKLDALLTTKLREFALELRALVKVTKNAAREVGVDGGDRLEEVLQSARKRKVEQMEEIYRILAITLGTPPQPHTPFTWEYYDKTKKYHSITTTPMEFYKTYSTVDVSRAISLINDPRNEYGQSYTVQHLGNVWEGRPVLYVNTEIGDLKKVAVDLLKAGTPVWFGCDVGKSSNSSLGIMDTELYDVEGAFGTSYGMSKAERLVTGDSQMTHAMTLTGVHLDADGNPVRWRVENSWGEAACDKGYMVMTDTWFTEHVFQIVADRAVVPKPLVDVYDNGKAKVLMPWDPMGALA
ncbi:bleomycin hydrolase [Meredithblackwellia eburnea MCA 4105]